MGASAAMLLRFKKEIIQAARKADNAIVNVVACESWVELKILVPYDRYRGKDGLDSLREAIEAENQGVVIPPFSMKWMKAWRNYEEQWQRGTLPRGRASVIFKVPNKCGGTRSSGAIVGSQLVESAPADTEQQSTSVRLQPAEHWPGLVSTQR
jgi:hypothetical protein